ncbi:MAG: STAS domain-containing protein [Cyclobacteriaceae bacterium]
MKLAREDISYSISGDLLTMYLHPEYLNEDECDLLAIVSELVVEYSLRKMLINLSKLIVLDAYQLLMIRNLSEMVKLLGASIVFSNIRPEVVSAVVTTGLDTHNLTFSSTPDDGLKLLSTST